MHHETYVRTVNSHITGFMGILPCSLSDFATQLNITDNALP